MDWTIFWTILSGGGGGTHHKFSGRGAMQSIVFPPTLLSGSHRFLTALR